VSTLNVDKVDPSTGTALEIGSSGDTITVPSGATFNVAGTLQEGGSALVTGKVLQVVQATATTAKSTTSTSYAASGVSVSITPSATSSKVLVLVGGGETTQGGGTAQGNVEMYSQTGGGGYSLLFNVMRTNTQDGNAIGQNMSNAYLHSPSTTSQVDYEIYFKTNANTYYINYNGHIVITAMEIGA
jgi:hypothetical protein|tara:strand:- start:185 stop:742 length:558 start_codon:yes stop_codon:yes gene_type:complete